MDLRGGKRLADPDFEVAGIETDADQERHRAILRIPERQGRAAERSAVDVEEPGVGLVGEQLDVGDGGIGDGDSGQGASGCEQLGSADDEAQFGLGVLDPVNHVGDQARDLIGGCGRCGSGGPPGDQAREVGGDVDDLGLDPCHVAERSRWE